jgi:photosystem II stability/assembly factor-like uncharacterized protein
MRLSSLVVLVSLFSLPLPQSYPPGYLQGTHPDTSFRGISASRAGKSLVLWVTGSNNFIFRSLDVGKSSASAPAFLHIHKADGQDLRGVRSFSYDIAYVFSVGTENKSHIYKTTNAGRSWHIQYSDPRPAFFLDGLVCRSEKNCFAISDPIDNKFPILKTEDSEHWTELPQSSEPAALPTEGLFAASNTSMILCGANNNDIFFATGGPAARVFHSSDNARTWTATTTPILSGNATAGIFSLACHDQTLVAVGGDYREPTATKAVAAYSTDFGATWHLSDQQPAGYRSAVTAVAPNKWIAVGTTGIDISNDNAAHWTPLNQLTANAVLAIDAHTVFTAGPKAFITQLKIP